MMLFEDCHVSHSKAVLHEDNFTVVFHSFCPILVLKSFAYVILPVFIVK